MPRPLLPTISSGWFEFLSEERSASELNPMIKAEGEGSIPATRARQSGRRRSVAHSKQKGPPMAGFRELEAGLRAPNSELCEANSPKVSGGHREYSRFRETNVGDRV